jgi:hypothetical protein
MPTILKGVDLPSMAIVGRFTKGVGKVNTLCHTMDECPAPRLDTLITDLAEHVSRYRC